MKDLVLEAIKASNNGHHYRASQLYQQAGNQSRNPVEKEQLWKVSDRSKQISMSD